MECKWFCVKVGGEGTVGEGYNEVHESNTIFSLAKSPSEPHVINNVLEGSPVSFILLSFQMAEPYANAIIDEPTKEEETWWKR